MPDLELGLQHGTGPEVKAHVEAGQASPGCGLDLQPVPGIDDRLERTQDDMRGGKQDDGREQRWGEEMMGKGLVATMITGDEEGMQL